MGSQGLTMYRLSSFAVLCLLIVGLRGQFQQEDRQAKELVVKKVRRLRPETPRSVPDRCPDEGVHVYPDPQSCNRFYKCEEGQVSLETCENGLLFDESMALTDAIHNYCVYNWKADCEGRNADNTPQSSPSCEYQWGLFPKSEGCNTEYIKCEAGVPSEMPCEAENPNLPVVLGLAYDPKMHSCNWPDLLTELGCDPTERLGGFQCPLLRELEGTFNEQFSPFPRFAVSDPRVYIICVDGLPRLQSCGAHDLFDQETLTCRRQPPAFGK